MSEVLYTGGGNAYITALGLSFIPWDSPRHPQHPVQGGPWIRAAGPASFIFMKDVPFNSDTHSHTHTRILSLFPFAPYSLSHLSEADIIEYTCARVLLHLQSLTAFSKPPFIIQNMHFNEISFTCPLIESTFNLATK